MASNPWDDNDDIGTPVAVSIALAKVLSSAIMMWFFILVCTAVVLFEFELKTRLEKMVETGLKDKRVVEDLVVWKDHHALVCKLHGDLYQPLIRNCTCHCFLQRLRHFHSRFLPVHPQFSDGFSFNLYTVSFIPFYFHHRILSSPVLRITIKTKSSSLIILF